MKPLDYLSGGTKPGEKYKAWKIGPGFLKPDLGKKKGPGIPYQQVEKTIPKGSFTRINGSVNPRNIRWGRRNPMFPGGERVNGAPWSSSRIDAIKRRMGNNGR